MKGKSIWRVVEFAWHADKEHPDGGEYLPEGKDFDDERDAWKYFDSCQVTDDTPQIEIFKGVVDKYGCVYLDTDPLEVKD